MGTKDVFVKIASFFTNDKFALVVAARLVSTISMTVSVYFVVKIAQKLLKGIYKYLFIVIIVFQPITAFLASYINNDSTAVLATTMIIYLWILGLESNWKTKHCILLGLSIGFCSLTYYNAYGYILCSVILCLVSVISNKMKIKEILQKAQKGGVCYPQDLLKIIQILKNVQKIIKIIKKLWAIFNLECSKLKW